MGYLPKWMKELEDEGKKEKIPKIEMFTEIRDAIDIPGNEIYVEFLNEQIRQVQKKADRERANRIKKRTEDDELTYRILQAIDIKAHGGYITVDQIMNSGILPLGATKHQVIYRLSELARYGELEKGTMRDETKKKNKDVVAYKLVVD